MILAVIYWLPLLAASLYGPIDNHYGKLNAAVIRVSHIVTVKSLYIIMINGQSINFTSLTFSYLSRDVIMKPNRIYQLIL